MKLCVLLLSTSSSSSSFSPGKAHEHDILLLLHPGSRVRVSLRVYEHGYGTEDLDRVGSVAP